MLVAVCRTVISLTNRHPLAQGSKCGSTKVSGKRRRRGFRPRGVQWYETGGYRARREYWQAAEPVLAPGDS